MLEFGVLVQIGIGHELDRLISGFHRRGRQLHAGRLALTQLHQAPVHGVRPRVVDTLVVRIQELQARRQLGHQFDIRRGGRATIGHLELMSRVPIQVAA